MSTTLHEISFACADQDRPLIKAILKRAHGMDLFRMSRREHEMDLLATHANGTPIDFQKLLNADDFNFVHDFCGITRHLDRSTGKLGNHFLPRCHGPLPDADEVSP